MTEIEKLAYNKMPDYLKIKSDHEPVLWSMGFEAGAAAVIELIRERMPGDAKEYWGGHDIEDKCRRIGWNDCRSEILKLLDTLK